MANNINLSKVNLKYYNFVCVEILSLLRLIFFPYDYLSYIHIFFIFIVYNHSIKLRIC